MSEAEAGTNDKAPREDHGTGETPLTEAQRTSLRDLSTVLSTSGLVLMALGIVTILYVLSFFFGHRRDPTPLVFAMFCAPMVLAGLWLRNAATALEPVAGSATSGVSSLMTALGEFRRVFSLQRWAYVIALAVAVVGVVVRFLV